ncbi:MAG: hypothetical protein JXB10_14630 [Pirellulales bacterium]|nr:hypothetical protein [Pirellulales bacterium]
MTLGGWIIMTLSVSFVTLLLAWSLYRVLRDSGPAPNDDDGEEDGE